MWGSSTSFARLERHMARELRQNHHYTGDMRRRVNKQHGETYKCQRGDHHFHSHKELPSEHPQSTIRMKRQIVSRYLRSFCRGKVGTEVGTEVGDGTGRFHFLQG